MLMESQHLSQQTFSQLTGSSSASLSGIFNDRTKPTLNHVEKIREKFPTVSLEWLMFGIGTMFQEQQSASKKTIPPPESDGQGVLDFAPEVGGSTSDGHPALSKQSVVSTPNNNVQTVVKFLDKPIRKVASIQVIYDDNTIEIFVPKK